MIRVGSANYVNAVIVLYFVTALLGAIIYTKYRISARLSLESKADIGNRLGRLNSRSTSSRSAWRCFPPVGIFGSPLPRQAIQPPASC
jgi:hypothetical protein